ncbi:MAG TPA: hypothetical protein VJH03_06845 [Blastocatellia bacterium]|nr:hypothetical protein [Blastocatellia bacterium]
MLMEENNEIMAILSQLNHWEQNYGTAHRDAPPLKDKGEANARIASLKRVLVERGARFHWNGTAYVLDSIVKPGQGEEIPRED